jgi:hypothetical protein
MAFAGGAQEEFHAKIAKKRQDRQAHLPRPHAQISNSGEIERVIGEACFAIFAIFAIFA